MEKNKLILVVFLTLLFIILSSLGYVLIDDYSFLDALYMTIISITSVGYGEIHTLSQLGRIHTMFVILIGFILLGYLLKLVSESVLEQILSSDYRRKKMIKTIHDLENHYIICGYGRIGQIITKELTKNNFEVVVIDDNKGLYDLFIKQHMFFMIGDATDEETLIESGIEKAKGLIVATPKDADNLYIIMTAKQINKSIYVLARSTNENSEKKLIRAGADKVFSPYKIGANRMVTSIIKPNVHDFLDFTLQEYSEHNITLEEFTLFENCNLIGKTLADTGLRKDYNGIVVAVKSQNGGGKMLFNPNFDYRLQLGDTLILIIEQSSFLKLKNEVVL